MCSFIQVLACVASISLQFWSKEQGTRVKDHMKNRASKRVGSGWGRKEGNAVSFLPLPLFDYLAPIPFFAQQKPKIPFLIIPWSFFALKPHGVTCYPRYLSVDLYE